MLPLLHNLRSRGAKNEQIRRARREHNHNRHTRSKQAGLGENPPKPSVVRNLTPSHRSDSSTGPCECEQDRQSGLEGEVGWEDGLLEGGERGARERFKGEGATEKGLE